MTLGQGQSSTGRSCKGRCRLTGQSRRVCHYPCPSMSREIAAATNDKKSSHELCQKKKRHPTKIQNQPSTSPKLLPPSSFPQVPPPSSFPQAPGSAAPMCMYDWQRKKGTHGATTAVCICSKNPWRQGFLNMGGAMAPAKVWCSLF